MALQVKGVVWWAAIAAVFCGLGCWACHASSAAENEGPEVINTQNPQDVAPTPQEALAKITVAKGFTVTLFAGEPDVRQPLAFCHDDRGRLWVVENYSYPEWERKECDRILIFEDTDNDGQFDTRKVFFDKGNQLTGIEIGAGGVWCTAAPYLIFIPDADTDDVPDGEPRVMLDGFNLREVGHNVVNGLRWGPDGWLYGRHGIKATSQVGRPGSPPEQRVSLNCSIWRFHPVHHTFEVVTHGTTNPWGFDYNDVGEMFFTNNVNGHLWHAVPGSHYQRMYGVHFNPHLYQLMQMCADHYHWAGTDWTDTRKLTGEPSKHDQYGGGHSHCGGMIYLGDNWPDEYRGHVFTCNTHGKRINQTLLERRGSGYVGRRGGDFLRANSDWFRGVELKYGPDGGVLVTDWTDLGECHDHDGIHRTSGRIYKVFYGRPQPLEAFDLRSLSSGQLVELQLHRNDWYVRHARRILMERAMAGQPMQDVHADLRRMFSSNPDVTRKLRAMWALYVTGGIDNKWLIEQLDHENEHVCVWAVRLLVDVRSAPDEAVEAFSRLARDHSSSLVRLYLASALQRLPLKQRWALVEALASHSGDTQDKDLPLMIWYGIEPAVVDDVDRALGLMEHTRIPLLRQFIARRIADELDGRPVGLDKLVALLGEPRAGEFRLDAMRGIRESLRGRRKVAAPPSWSKVRAGLSESSEAELRELSAAVAVVFGDGLALEDLRKTMFDKTASPDARRRAIRTLVEVHAADLAGQLQKLINDREVHTEAIRGLAGYDDPKTIDVILRGYPRFDKPEKQASIDVLVSRPQYADALLAALANGAIPPADVTAVQARQILALNDGQLASRLDEVWGTVRATPEEKHATMQRYKQMLSLRAASKADLSNGRQIYKQRCAQCHKLFDDGGEIGPDLTGSGRAELDYVLQNIVDPSAVVAADYRMSVIVLDDGRVLSGTVHPASEQTVAIQTAEERFIVERRHVEEMQKTQLSLMPDGLLKELGDQEVRDLVGYLASPAQVPLCGEVADEADKAALWKKIAPYFQPPPELADDLGDYRSPLKFYDGSQVTTPSQWRQRRAEIRAKWHQMMGPWPKVDQQPRVDYLETTRRENFSQHKVQFNYADGMPTTGYLLIPDGKRPMPGVVVVYYEPESGIGLGSELRDFAYQLARRGFATLSIGHKPGLEAKTYALYIPNQQDSIQPLSALAYGAANAYHVLCTRPEVDAARVGIVGHSFGGKWAMFASCLYDRYAAAAWSDPGIVFDPKRPSVNYWEPWYLGFERGKWRTRGMPSPENPLTGLYKELVETDHDLHELHALMAPRPLLVSGGSEDAPQRWQALNHSRAVNQLLGYTDRVAMHNRPNHSPTEESNEIIYLFFEYFLKYGQALRSEVHYPR